MLPLYSCYLMPSPLSQTVLFERSHPVSYAVKEGGLCYTSLEVEHHKLLEVLLHGRMKSLHFLMCFLVYLYWPGFTILILYFCL